MKLGSPKQNNGDWDNEEPNEKTIRMRKGIPPLHVSVEERAKLLRKIQARWKECGEEECAAIYQGAAFELELFQSKITALETENAELRKALDGIETVLKEALCEDTLLPISRIRTALANIEKSKSK